MSTGGAISPTDPSTGTVGVIGRGYISVLAAKLAALRGYDTWFICPPGEEPTVQSLLSEDGDGTAMPDRLSLVEAADSDAIERKIGTMSALLIAVDDTTALDTSVIEYLLNPEVATKCRRVVGMSRNLNGSNMGLFVKASKATANSGVWDNSNAEEFRRYEQALKDAAQKVGAEWTICRAGTLKGGACGDVSSNEEDDGGGGRSEYCPQYLSSKFYELTKKDIVTWNLLFDCNVRGVKVTKGDVLPGPGGKAIFTATSAEECDGDTSRAGLAEAMVRSLEMEQCGNIEFGVGTKEGRVPPSEEEWKILFEELV